MTPLTPDRVEFDLTAEPEDPPLDGNLCSHDGDEACYAHVREELAAGNEWAWCVVTVRATWKGFVGTDTLGGYSYASEAEFKQPRGYYEDLRAAALADLNATVERYAKANAVTQLRDEAGDLPVFAWPGGYPLVFATKDGGDLCPRCANEHASEAADDPAWRLVGFYAHYEGEPVVCDHCGKAVASAYGEPEAV